MFPLYALSETSVLNLHGQIAFAQVSEEQADRCVLKMPTRGAMIDYS